MHDLKWRFGKTIGFIKLDDKIIEMLKLGYTFGLAPAYKVSKDADGNVKHVELLEISLIPQKNIVPYTKPINEDEIIG